MQSRLNPYISFRASARAAMEFYKTVFGGKLEITSFKEAGSHSDPGEENNIMHAMLVADNGMVLMASDTPSSMKHDSGTNISLSLSGDNEDELRGYWNKLSEGASIEQPLEKAPWGDTFGMLKDKFGTMWMVNITSNRKE